jgi:alpha-amylase/alpha-mannosidase (GH57 family)
MPQNTPPFHLVLIIHAHQPAGNFENVLEDCYEHSYDAFLSLVEQHPRIRMALHVSGPLFQWLDPAYFERLHKLVTSDQIELVGGGFFEPILISIPEADRRWFVSRTTLKSILANAPLEFGLPNACGSLSWPPRSHTPTWRIPSSMIFRSWLQVSSHMSCMARTLPRIAVKPYEFFLA